jgi:PhnB protein
MAERDLAERFAEVVETILTRPDQAAVPPDAELAELFRVAVDLVDLPRQGYRTRLMADLGRRAGIMKQATAVPYVPRGFRSLTPYLIVPGADAFIGFVRQVFDAEEVFRTAQPGGAIMHAEVRVGDSMLELSDGGEAFPPRPAAIHVYVPDADATYARAMAAGCRSLVAPMDMPYGDREADVTDPFGNNWYIGTRQEGGPVPPGMGTLTPTLHVQGTDRLIDFIKRAFGAEELDRAAEPDGTVLHAQLKLGDSVLELGEARGFVKPMPAAIHYYVEDVDRVYASALAAGATTLGAPSRRPYGDYAAEVVDPFGNYWFLATQVEDARYR